MDRISKEEHYLGIAREVSRRSTCLRRHYGAIIVKNDEIISTGYNGAARGEENCCDKGECYRASHNIPHGEQYEKCVAVHAEQNAIISAARRDMIGSTLYLAGYDVETSTEIEAEPCLICSRMIANAGIAKIVTLKDVADKVIERVETNPYGLCKCHRCNTFPAVDIFIRSGYARDIRITCPVCGLTVRDEVTNTDYISGEGASRIIRTWNYIHYPNVFPWKPNNT